MASPLLAQSHGAQAHGTEQNKDEGGPNPLNCFFPGVQANECNRDERFNRALFKKLGADLGLIGITVSSLTPTPHSLHPAPKKLNRRPHTLNPEPFTPKPRPLSHNLHLEP